MRAKDEKALQEELNKVRQALNEAEEANKLLKLQCVKYEKRAKYAVSKFFEIKRKELQLIQYGEEKGKSKMLGDQEKWRKQAIQLKERVRELEHDKEQMLAAKRTGRQQNSRWRDDYEKSQKLCEKLLARLKLLEEEKAARDNEAEIQQDIATTMIETAKE